jgi:P27 family predicted phage terminase small subunit
VKLLRGETRPSRLNLTEPVAPILEPVTPPDYLDTEALAVWNGLAPSMIARGALTVWDVDLFAAFCTAVVHHRRAVRTVNDTAVLLKTPAGAVKHPAMQVIRDQAALMAQIGGQFGLSPAVRSALRLAVVDEPSSILD